MVHLLRNIYVPRMKLLSLLVLIYLNPWYTLSRTFMDNLLKLRHRFLELKYSMRVDFAPTVVVNMSCVVSTSTFHSKVMQTVARP